MAKENMTKENPVVDVLRKLKEEEAELLLKIKPVQEAISALEKIIDKSAKKPKQSSGVKENSNENLSEDLLQEMETESN